MYTFTESTFASYGSSCAVYINMALVENDNPWITSRDEEMRRYKCFCCGASDTYRGVDKSLARPNSLCTLFNGENI